MVGARVEVVMGLAIGAVESRVDSIKSISSCAAAGIDGVVT
jgi:hypothetical protein